MDISGYAMVVGGGGGIGKACAILLAQEGAAGVAIADLDAEAAANAAAECKAVAINAKFRVEQIHIDLTLEDSVKLAMAQTLEAFGRIDYCVNCAGLGAQGRVDITDVPLADFKRFLDVNATGMFLVTREASTAMRSQELKAAHSRFPDRGTTRGAIVNLCSASSLVPTPGILSYTASKHAAIGLSKNAALDNVPYGIRVNCVCPTWVDTPMVRRAIEGDQGFAQLIKQAVPMGRVATPEEIADSVVFLCSPRSSYVTGCGFIIDGGTTLTAST